MQTRVIRAFGVAALLASSLFAGAGEVGKGEVFPNFTDRDLVTNKQVDLKALRGKAVLIDFWATWCGPCVAELPNVKDAYKKYKDQGFEIVSISLDNDKGKCKSFVEREHMSWLHICDGKGWGAELAKRFGVNAIPQMYVLGRDGKVVARDVRGEALGKAIEEALKTKHVAEVVDDDVEKEAEDMLAKADAERAAGRHAAALAMYDEIGTKYVGRPSAKTANERAREMREDPAIQAAIKKGDAKPEVKSNNEAARWLTLARSMRDSKKPDQAREYYQKIIDKHPDSAEAKTAKAEMEKLGK
ncbi:MAG: redoxin family protein [Phycisphaerales bacterium]|nr:redoxin family protein [Phycisphaerales bacterium]